MIESTTDFLDDIVTGIQQLKFFDPIFKETLNASTTPIKHLPTNIKPLQF